MGKKTESEKPVIHVIVRTHRRKELFMMCMESIAAQTYNKKLVHVIADDDITAKYVKEAVSMGLIDFYYRVDGGMLKESPLVFQKLLKQGLVKRRDNSRCTYNLYLNSIINKLPPGWVFIVDDDKELPHEKILTTMAKYMSDEDVMVVGQYAMQSKIVPDGIMWGKVPFTRGHIDMSCCVWHVKHRDVAIFDAHKASDWRVANYLANVLKLKWVKEPFVIADNDGMFGKEVDK